MNNEGWQSSSLGDRNFALTASGGTPDRSDPSNFGGDIPWVKSGELNDNIIYATEEKLTERGVRNSSAKLFPRGTLLLAMYGATAGKTGILGIEATTNQAVCAIFAQNGSFDSRFLQFQLIYDRPKLLNARSGGAQPNISQRVIGTLDVVLPPIEEQRAIARALDAVEKAKDARQHELVLERERKAALMEYLFTHGTRSEPTKQTEIGEIPESWRVVRLGTVADIKGGKRLPKGVPFATAKTSLPYIRVVDFKDGSVRMSELKYLTPQTQRAIARYIIRKEDVYISIAGTIGLVGTIPDMLDGANLTENAARLVIKNRQSLSNRFLASFLDSERGQSQISNLTAKTTQPKLALTRIEQIVLPLPSIEEQQEISNLFSSCDAKVRALESENQYIGELLCALLDELMTGRLSALPLIEEQQVQ